MLGVDNNYMFKHNFDVGGVVNRERESSSKSVYSDGKQGFKAC